MLTEFNSSVSKVSLAPKRPKSQAIASGTLRPYPEPDLVLYLKTPYIIVKRLAIGVGHT